MLFWYLNGEPIDRTAAIEQLSSKKIVLWGNNRRNVYLYDVIEKDAVVCVFESDEKLWGTLSDGIPVVCPAKKEDVVLVSASYSWEGVSSEARGLGYSDVYFFLPEADKKEIDQYVDVFFSQRAQNTIPGDRTYKYIHFIPDEKFFLPVFEMIEYGLNVEDHFFIVHNIYRRRINARYGYWEKYKELMNRYHNIYLLHNMRPTLLNNWAQNEGNLDRLLDCADKVIIHSEYPIGFTKETCLHTRLHILEEKGVGIPWGFREENFSSRNHQFMLDVFQHLRLQVLSNKEAKARFCRRYSGLRAAAWLENGVSYARLTKKPVKKQTRNILICHSAWAYTKAIDTMEYLSEIDQSFTIYALISYGKDDGKDAVEIEKCGERIFGDRFVAVKDFMDYEAYVEFLSGMQIAIFGMEEMAGRDTMELLFWTGAKIFLKPGTTVWRRMAEERGYRPADYYSVKGLSAKELLDNPDAEWNGAVAASEFDADIKVQQWKELFEYDFEGQEGR